MLLFIVISRMPFWLLYLTSDLLAFFAEYMLRYRHKVILTNLKNSFPEKSDREIRKLKKAFYLNLTDVALETFKLLSIPAKKLDERVRFVNIEKIDSFFEAGNTVIATTSHLCNWEWMLAASAVHLKAPAKGVYQKIKNPFFEHLMFTIRSRFGSRPVLRNQVLRESLRDRENPHVLALVADQSPPLVDENVIWTKFLNQDTAFYPGMARLAKSLHWPILFAVMKRVSRGHYTIEFKDVCPDPKSVSEQVILDRYAKLVEGSIREDPSSWLWSHRRWKKKKPG